MKAEKKQLATTGITCPMCWTPIALMTREAAMACALDVLTLGFECETCGSTFIASYEQIGDKGERYILGAGVKGAWKSRVLV